MQNDKNINNEFLALVYGPPAYELTLSEIKEYIKRIDVLLTMDKSFTAAEINQLNKYADYYFLSSQKLLWTI
jgi:hypothetical protein